MTRPFVLAVLVAAIVVVDPGTASAQRQSSLAGLVKRIDSLAGPEAKASLLSGVILVAKGDSILMQRGYGFSNWELRTPNTAATRIGIGSINKPMTQAVIEMLAQEGKIDTAAPVAKYLSGFPSGPKGGQPTVAQLLAHRGGVPFRVTTEIEESTHLTPADIVERVRAKGLLFEPGAREEYSSAGYTSLARVVEVVTGQPFDSVLAARVFRPVGMRLATGETGEQLMVGRAPGYRMSAGATRVTVASAPYKDLGFLTGAGSVYATAADMLRFVRAVMTKKLGTLAYQELSGATDTSWASSYGRTSGYESSVDYYPPRDITVVFLSNLRSGSNWQLRQAVRSLVAGRPVVPIEHPPLVAALTEKPADFVGGYGDPSDPVIISQVGGRLYRDEDEFYPIGGGVYYDPPGSSTFRFIRGAGGAVDSMFTHFGGGRERTYARVSLPK